ncbi:g6077 [Coccomyxa elongata]
MHVQGEEGDSVYEWMVREDGSGWRAWRDQVPKWIYPANAERPNFSQLLIPTADSVRYEHLLRLVFSVGKASLLVGGPGTAKTSIINLFMGRFTPEETTSKTITFSSLTTPAIFQTAVEGCVEKRQGRTYGPVGGKTMAIFVDDLSMPAVNEWGDQVTNEIVRQLLEQGGMYSLEKPIGDMRYIIDTRFVAAMNMPGGGKNDIPNRLKRQFCIFYVPPPPPAAVNSIFGALVQGRFDASRFGTDVVELASKLVPATLALWNKVAAKMLPTPAKFHYLFNMRELSKVFQGLLLADPTRFDKTASGGFGDDVTTCAGYLAALWVHECGRVFGDKMITKEDGAWVDNAIRDLARQHFPAEVAAQLKRPMHFVDFLREPTTDPETGEVIDAHPSVTRAEALQRRFNEESRGTKLELVLFQDALTHLTRISRALAMDRGNVLLVGVGGSGKQSLARLAAYIAGAYCFQITITKTYNTANLFEDLKNLCKIAGVKGQPVAFIFTDAEVKEEGFLEYINQLLMTGEVAGLLPKEELESILNDVRPVFKRECIGVPDTADNLYTFFLGRVRDRLHVILCFSPVGAKFARRAQQFPGLISGCTIDWFLPWPEEALTEVAGKYINDFPMACSDSVKASLKSLMGSVHVGVSTACQEYYEKFRRHVYVTPKSYMSFLEGFRSLYTSKLTETRELAGAINNGLDKMNGAKVDVNRMKDELAIKNVELAAASQEAEKLLKDISESTAVAEKEKAKVAVILDQVSKTASEIAAVKDDAEKDLAAAKPALDAALSALNSITPKDIVALKALKNPPDIVKRIFDCVLLLRYHPVQKVAWQDVKGSQVLVGNYDEAVKMMGDTAFLSSLINFPKEAITDETVELLKPYFKAPDFNFESAKKASGNVAGLCNWAAAMCTYHDVAKVVEPKIVALRGAENELKSATKEKDAAEAELAIVQSKLDAMQADFDAAMRQKQALEEDAAATKRRMDTANALLGALAGEETRWTEQSKAFDDQIQRLTGDCAIASSFVSYLGPFNKEFRELLLARNLLAGCRRLGIPFTRDLKLSAFLADDAEVGEWTLQGLPTDELSVQNGIMVARASRFPVLIDPQGQGRAWLLQREAPRGLRVTHLPDKNFRNVLEDCLANGKPLLIENIEEELDPVLDPVLEKRFIRQARGLTLQLNDKEVEYNESFRLYCTTRLPRPHFTPELSANVTLVDFTVTQAGLEDQLLGKLILKEKTELEEQSVALMEEVQSYRRRIKQLEDDLLFRLSNSQGNLLDDTELIGVLAVTKATAAQVNQKLAGASEARRRISEACEEYRPVAHRAQIIYFLIAQFSTVNCMYQTSLAQASTTTISRVAQLSNVPFSKPQLFNRLYELAIDTSERAAVSSKRIHNIIEHMTYEIYLYIQRGLFERHKIIFALLLALSVLTSAGKIKLEEVDIFLKGGGALDINSVKKKPKEWIPDAMWLGVVALGSMGAFRDIIDSVTRAEGLWRRWYDAEAPERAPVPEYEERLSKFERMCIVRAWREDRALVAAADVIADALGQRFVDSVPLNMERAWAESAPNVPVICLLSPGADPTKLIEDLAKRKKIRTLGVSMGQGQEIIARNLLAAATADGQWLLLQNTHLGLAYLSELEGVLSKTEGVHENFRLWITAEPHSAFPIGLLQMGIKLTNEAPVGMQAGMRASYQWINQDMLEAVNLHEWRQLLFVTTFLHSIVQERRKFGPIGWNVPYEFNQSDLSACIQFLQNHLLEMDAKRASAPTWETVRYMVSAIQYGGRITDEFDKLLMHTYAEKYFQQGVLIPNYILYKDVKGGAAYSVPQGTEIETYRKAVEEIPNLDSPELFGLHPNADLTFRSLQVQAAVQLVLETRPQGGTAGGGSSREEVVDKLCEELLSKAPPLFEKEDVREKLRKLPGGPSQPLTVHLRQEIDRINSVILLTVSRLKDLRLAVAGTIALSGQLADSLEALYNARIPRDWLAKSWEASTLGNWFSGLLARHEQLAKWLSTGRPKAYWLTGFFNPQGFLTAVKQEVSRRHAADKWALDDVVLTSEVTHPAKDLDGIKEAPAEGVYVYGLYLDGCAWSVKGNRLIDSEPKKLFNPLPVLYVTGVQAKDKKKGGVFEAPVYRVKKRTGLNYITSFPLRTDEPPSKWILRGVALLCSTD